MNTLTAALVALTLAQAPAPAASPAPAGLPAPAATGPAATAPAALVPSVSVLAIPAGPVLSLGDALRRADEANLDLQVAQARLEQARAGVWKAWSYHLPQLTAGGTWTHNDTSAAIPMPDGSQITLQASDPLAGQVQVTQALIAPSLWFAIRASGAGQELAAKTVEQARRDVLFGVAQSYYGVTSLRKLVRISEELLGTAQRQERDARVRLEAGTIAKVAHLRAQIDLARAEQDLVRASNAYQGAKISLATLLDRDDAFEVVEPPEPAVPADAAGLEASALEQRPDVLAARRNVDLATELKRATAGRYLPSLGAFGRWQVSDPAGLTGDKTTWAAGLALNWTLFDGGLREAELREGGAKVAEATAARRSLERKAVAEVRQALLDLESARANAVKAQEQARLAKENQRLVDVSYRAGAATAVEQADATAALRTAAIAAASDELAAQLAALKLLKAAGAFDPVPRR
ncbi:MAG: TolC family protein [Anaeromyxobacter sp.]|nr:TolC family protein [Anaeromyxobacter sp.]MBL0275260.1 TolC family protein [Anaeromyxobacter sp.]